MLLRLLVLQVISTFFALCSLRLKEIEKLIQKFDAHLDINYIFYDKVLMQKSNPLVCNAELGPHCSLINNESILDKVNYTNDTPEVKVKKASIVQDWDQIRQKERNSDAFYVVKNNHDSIFGNQAPVVSEVNALMTFDEILLTEKEFLLDQQAIYYEFGNNFVYGSSPAAMKIDISKALKITFKNIYAPDENKIFNKKTIHDAQKYEQANKGTDMEMLEPIETYVDTKKDGVGTIYFSQPVIVKQLYVRKHNFLQYENERRAKGKANDGIQHHLLGRYKGADAVEFSTTAFLTFNKWVKITPNKENVKIDSLVLDPNTDIDNVMFLMEKPKLDSLTNQDLTDLYTHLTEKLNQFATLKDEKLKIKIIKEDLESYLEKKKISKSIIKQIVDNLEIYKFGQDAYKIEIKDAWVLLGGDAATTNNLLAEQLNEMIKANPQIKDNLEQTLFETLGQTGDLSEESKKEIRELLKMFESSMSEEEKSDDKKKVNKEEKKQNKDGQKLR